MDGRVDAASSRGSSKNLERSRLAASASCADVHWRDGSPALPDGNPEAAIQLERVWDDLTRGLPFLTVCLYSTECFGEGGDPELFRRHLRSPLGGLPRKRQIAVGETSSRGWQPNSRCGPSRTRAAVSGDAPLLGSRFDRSGFRECLVLVISSRRRQRDNGHYTDENQTLPHCDARRIILGLWVNPRDRWDEAAANIVALIPDSNVSGSNTLLRLNSPYRHAAGPVRRRVSTTILSGGLHVFRRDSFRGHQHLPAWPRRDVSIACPRFTDHSNASSSLMERMAIAETMYGSDKAGLSGLPVSPR